MSNKVWGQRAGSYMRGAKLANFTIRSRGMTRKVFMASINSCGLEHGHTVLVFKYLITVATELEFKNL